MPYDVYAHGQKIKVDHELPRAFIDGALFLNQLVGEDLDIVNRHWKSHYKIKGSYPTATDRLSWGQKGVVYQLHGVTYTTIYTDPAFVDGIHQAAQWLGLNLDGFVAFIG
jgi:hypothetical protein